MPSRDYYFNDGNYQKVDSSSKHWLIQKQLKAFAPFIERHRRFISAPQVREAYLHFMVSIAKIAREDRNLTQDDDRVWEEMGQVLDLETDIANVSG